MNKLGTIIGLGGKTYKLSPHVNGYSCQGCAGYGIPLCSVFREKTDCQGGIWVEDNSQNAPGSVPATPPATLDPLHESIDRLLQLWDAKASCDEFEAQLEIMRQLRKGFGGQVMQPKRQVTKVVNVKR